MRYQPEWAPDGKRIAFSDKDGKLYVVTLADRKMIEIADAPHGQIRDYIWSPRGNYLAFSYDDNPNRFSAVCVWSRGRRQAAHASPTTCSMPTIRPGIRRETISTFSAIASFNHRFRKSNSTTRPIATAYIYAMALRKDVKHPFPPESDEVTISKPDEAPKPKGTPPGEEPKPPAKDINKELKEPAKEPAKPRRS